MLQIKCCNQYANVHGCTMHTCLPTCIITVGRRSNYYMASLNNTHMCNLGCFDKDSAAHQFMGPKDPRHGVCECTCNNMWFFGCNKMIPRRSRLASIASISCARFSTVLGPMRRTPSCQAICWGNQPSHQAPYPPCPSSPLACSC